LRWRWKEWEPRREWGQQSRILPFILPNWQEAEAAFRDGEIEMETESLQQPWSRPAAPQDRPRCFQNTL
jgi:hypothetical protein